MSSRKESWLKANMLISKYLLFSFPIVVVTIIWALSVTHGGNGFIGLQKIIWEIVSWHFLLWFALLVYFFMSLAFWGEFREKVLSILTLSKERDERETYISGRAGKATFYSTLSVLILFFFLSGLHVNIYRKPKEEAVDGKRGNITIGYRFQFVNSVKTESAETVPAKAEKIFVMNGIPFTQEALFLFLICYHVASFHIFTRLKDQNA